MHNEEQSCIRSSLEESVIVQLLIMRFSGIDKKKKTIEMKTTKTNQNMTRLMPIDANCFQRFVKICMESNQLCEKVQIFNWRYDIGKGMQYHYWRL